VAVVFVLVLAAVAGLIAGCGGGLPKDAMAQVGSEYITQKDFDSRLADFETQYAGQIPDEATDPDGYKTFKQQVLDYLVTYEMVVQKSSELGISVSDAEVKSEIESIKTNSFGGDQAKFDEALKAQGVTLEQLTQSYKESMLLQKAYDQVTKDVTSVPDADISKYYDEHKSDYYSKETRNVRHILISPTADRPTTTTTSTTETTSTTSSDSSTTTASESTTTTAPATEAEWSAALTKAKEVRTKLVAGGDWTELAKEYSNDPGTADSGGDLGAVYKGEMVAEFEDSVFSLEKDDISEPVKTTYGYHVIQVTGITEAKQSTLEEVKTDISSILVNEAKTKTWEEWLTKTKAELKVVYKEGMELTTTTTGAATTTVSGETTTTVSDGAPTTSAPATTEAPATTTTTAQATTTTVKP
jgi:foldase protein PrsA